jgi:hypothetical protein
MKKALEQMADRHLWSRGEGYDLSVKKVKRQVTISGMDLVYVSDTIISFIKLIMSEKEVESILKDSENIISIDFFEYEDGDLFVEIEYEYQDEDWLSIEKMFKINSEASDVLDVIEKDSKHGMMKMAAKRVT